MGKKLKILQIEGNKFDTELIQSVLAKGGMEAELLVCEAKEEVRQALQTDDLAIILVVDSVPDFDNHQTLKIIRDLAPEIPAILIGSLDEDTALNFTRAGAFDYVGREHLVRLLPVINRALEHRRLIAGKREVEKLLRFTQFALDHAANFVAWVNPRGQFIYVNQKASSDLNYPPQELLSHTFYDFIPELSRESWPAFWEDLIQKQHQTFKSHFITRTGNRLPIEISVNYLEFEGQGYACVVARGMSEHPTTEEALRRSEEKYRDLVESIDEGICVLDATQSFTFVNRAAAKIFGYSKDDLIGKKITGLVPDSESAHLTQQIQMQKSGLSSRYELVILRRDGENRTLSISATPIFDARKAFQGALIILYDVTLQKQTENALHESEKKFRGIAERSYDAILILNTEQVITYCSPAAQKILGFQCEEMLNQPVEMFFSGRETEQLLNVLQQTLNGQVVTKVQLEIKNRQKASVLIEANSSPVFKANQITGIQLIFRDITESRQLEEQFRQAQKMEAVGRLAGGVAHDFNNLLTAILGYSELLLLELATSDPMYATVQEIERAGRRAESLTRQLLAFSRKQVLHPEILNLEFVLKNMENMLRRLLGEDIELITIIQAENPHIKADLGQIEQVLMNLVVNARDAMPVGGKLTINLENVIFAESVVWEDTIFNTGKYVQIEISDTGTGIKQEIVDHIFEPFFTTKKAEKGTGLGLSVVSGIVKQSGGMIQIKNTPGEGSRFFLIFPEEMPVSRLFNVKKPEAALRGTEIILVAEDEKIVRDLACQVLRIHGYTVLEAPNGGSALLKCEQFNRKLDLILTDVVMPEMNGAELVNRLKMLHPESQVLYMSGYSDDNYISAKIPQKNLNFIQKPFTPLALLRKVRNILDANQIKA